MTEPRHGGTLIWRPSEADRLAEVDHVDGRRRPWRAGLVAVLVAGGVVALAPWPAPWSAAIAAIGAAALAGIAAWRFPLIRSGRGLAAGAPPEIVVAAEERALTVWRAGFERRVAPQAVERLIVGADHVFLHLAEAEVLTIPCRVFGAEPGGLDRFVAQVDGFRRGGAPLADAPEPERGAWVLRYGWGGWLTAVAMGVSGRRAPVGPVDLAVGPAGGWMRSRGGSTRFGWARVFGIEVSPRLVVFRFADRVVPIPSDAFEHEPERLRFLADVRDWWTAARAHNVRPAQLPALGPPADPFAPPAGG